MQKLSTDCGLPEDGTRQQFKRAVLDLYRYPGTMRLCMSCRCHTQRYYGGKSGKEAFNGDGWTYCDRSSEATTIRRPVEGECHWYEPTKTLSRHTPLVGPRQATFPYWPDPVNPDFEASGPLYDP